MRKRDVQLVMRMLALLLVAVVAALGVLIVLQNSELDKLVGASRLRTALVVLAPVASIALINYSMVAKSIVRESLLTEVYILAGTTLAYLAVVLSVLFGTAVEVETCPFYKPFCQDEIGIRTNWHLGVLFSVASLTVLVAALRRAGILRRSEA